MGGGTFAYNAAGEMSSAAGVAYTYDGDGRRVQKSSGTLSWCGMSAEPLEETDGSGTLTNDYIFLGSQLLARRDGSANVFAYFPDHLGSSRKVEEIASGASSASLSYDGDFYPYGREQAFVGTSNPIHKFTGKERDTETGNDYFGARYFSSTIGRFMSADWSSVPVAVPYANLTNPQTLNLYAIVHDNPETFGDLDGHCDADHVQDCKDNATTANGALPAAGETSPTHGDGTSSDQNGAVRCANSNCTKVTQTVVVKAQPDEVPAPISGVPNNWALFGWDANAWGVFGRTLFSWQPQKDALHKGYYGCLLKQAARGATAPVVTHGVGAAATNAAESGASTIAGAYYHFTDGRFTAWGKYSEVLVPNLAPKIATAAKVLDVVGWAYFDYELARAIGECSEVVQ